MEKRAGPVLGLVMWGAWLVSTLPVFLPNFRETFRLSFALDVGKSGAASCL